MIDELEYVRKCLGDWHFQGRVWRIKELNENSFIFGWSEGVNGKERADDDLSHGDLHNAYSAVKNISRKSEWILQRHIDKASEEEAKNFIKWIES